MKKIKEKLTDKCNICFFIILLIAILSRIVLLEQFPNGIHEDEAGMMYDAFCMAEYGTDRYLNENPAYLINFGGGQSVLYAVIASLFIRLFGLSVFIIRLPAVIFSITTIILAYLLSKKYIGKKFALIFSFLIAICPWHIMQSRWGLDCNLLSSFIMISVYALLNARKNWHYIIVGTLWGITLYTYALSYIMLPVFFILLSAYLLYIKHITVKQILITIIPIFILALPLILVQVVNYFDKATIKFGFITIPHLFKYRASEIGIDNIVNNLNIFRNNNVFQLLFSADHNPGNSLKEFGTIYYTLIPFSILGLMLVIKKSYEDIKKKKFNLQTVFLIQFISIFMCVLVFADLQLYKLNPLFIMLLSFASEVIILIYNKKKLIAYIILIVCTLMFILFECYYFKNINYKVGAGFNTDFIPLVEYLEKEYPNQEIFIETDAIQQYIYLLLAKKISPYEFMNDMKIVQFNNGDTEVIKVGRYHFLFYNIDKTKIYVLEEDNLFRKVTVDKLKKELEQEGFKYKKYNNFLIYTYSE